ncbi:MAG: hypothetical protein KIS73_22830 [Enhydrobacter sp.]|nr:hypothetical protein [Enhydrobacter sp.]
MKLLAPAMLALAVAACAAPLLPEPSPADASSPEAPAVASPYQPVMAGTAPHLPVGLKPWRELNDSVAPPARRPQ